MKKEEIIYIEEELEFFKYLKLLREMLKDVIPWNEECDRFQKDQLLLYKGFETMYKGFIKDAQMMRIKDKNKENLKWNTYHNEVCPECKKTLQQKPVGEIKLQDGLTYFQFYCQRCSMNFEGKKPNNDDDLVIWHYNLLDFWEKVDKNGIKVFRALKMSEKEVKKYRIKADVLRDAVANGHVTEADMNDAYQKMIEHIKFVLNTIKTSVDAQNNGTNIFGIRPKSTIDGGYRYSKNEKELMNLLDYLKQEKEKSNPVNDTEKNAPKSLFDGLGAIEEELKEYVQEITAYRKSREAEEFDKWNRINKVVCTHCKKEMEKKPYGEVLTVMHYHLFAYFCIDCQQIFFPNISHNSRHQAEILKNALHDKLTNPNNSNANWELFGTVEDAIEMVKQGIALNEQQAIQEEEYAASMEKYIHDHKETVNKNLGELIMLKQQLITGSSIMGES